ncbi:MAG: ATP-grasp fold amidoligase family protein [Xanthobacteraceae bacterium]|jgi:hypothetical protein
MLLRSALYPRTHNEKIRRVKILNRDPRLPQRADKILVKDFVRDQLGSEWITPTLWHGKHLPPLKQRTWPIPFVIKANNGCGWNFFVRQESDLDWKRIESLTAEWRSRPYGAEWGEWLYGAISPALLVEPFVGERWEYPIDYKLWTFGGKVQIIGVGTDRHSDLKFSMFDSNWNRLPFKSPLPTDLRPLPKPQSLSRMIEAAEILAEDFPFVRTDFYEVNSIPKFGEMTFYPQSGLDPFDPPEWDFKLGRLWPKESLWRLILMRGRQDDGLQKGSAARR